MWKVAVVFGGKSCESEISILTGVFVLNVLDRTKFSPVPIYVHTDGKMYTGESMRDVKSFQNRRVDAFERVVLDGKTLYAVYGHGKKRKALAQMDVGINCCHGGLGEGGGVSAMFEWHGIPLASPDLTASGVLMDKCLTKLVLKSLKIPVVDYIRVNEKDYQKRGAFLLKRIASRLKYPIIVKPAHLGSSIGISVAYDETQAKIAIESAFLLDDRVLIEKFLDGKKDVNCAAYARNGEIFVSEPETAFEGGMYSFEDKYIKKKQTQNPPKASMRGKILTGELRDKIRSYTKTVYKRLDLKGVVRMDFLVYENKAYLCEVNTVPGSLAYYLFCERISDARAFFSELLQEALEEGGKEKKIVTTGILKGATFQNK